MNLESKFTEDDLKRIVELVNMFNAKMSFDAGLKLPDVTSLVRELAWFQNSFVKKVEANILEVVPIQEHTNVENTPPEESAE